MTERLSATLVLRDLAATEALARRIAGALRKGDLVALRGDLGAGKTTLVRYILRALGIGDAVPSPSFTLLQEYETPALRISHFDLYRIEDPSELDELGFDEALETGAAMIEWPERAGTRLPDDRLDVTLEILSEGERRVTLAGPAHWACLTP